MASRVKSKAIVSSSEGSDSDTEYKPKPKKQKKEEKKTKAPKKNSDDASDDMIALAKMRYVTVRDFKGKVLIDIREYYNDNSGELKPGRKGISLNKEQWDKLKESIGEIDEKIEELS
ncbi:activated RNA polymerase II transcriptional coactivator p15-like [Saccoglossus kowalevskii]|uniref:Activated RNA polymerase II transcriptional coactivator p15-like isoform X1 n=1 Tax=Saccoglossus kowalevskii TaxID=10224 RepID=A0ABM0GMI5_SACKO|nr:PREDICTED: activated RNA polymerase II transcriptional coactivator p15-like isoform X1 [Saccoglossus kowalevskii]